MNTDMMMLIDGFANNLIIMLLSAILPLAIGIPLIFAAHRNQTVGKVFHWISLPFECLCPAIFIVVCAFGFFASLPIDLVLIPAIAAFTLSFIGYMPARYEPIYSIGKNIIYNTLGLFSAIFKWSFCASLIGAKDMLFSARNIASKTFTPDSYVIVLIASFAVILLFEIARRIVKQRMK